MKSKFKLLILISLCLVVIYAGSTLLIYSQKDFSNNQVVKLDKHLPIANYDAPLPINPGDRLKRELKSRARNLRPSRSLDSRKFMITEQSSSLYGGFESEDPDDPAIPAAQSQVILIGEVMDGSAYLTEDKISVYSEFNTKILSLIKNSANEKLRNGNIITVSRGGGAIRFSSGKVIERAFNGKPMPEVGKTYIFFLRYISEFEDFPIVTAYELQNGTVIPLDGLENGGRIVRQLAAQQSYRGMSQSEFLSLVENASKNSIDIFEPRRQ